MGLFSFLTGRTKKEPPSAPAAPRAVNFNEKSVANFAYTAMAIETASKSSKSICRIAFIAYDKKGNVQTRESIDIKPPGKTFSFSAQNGITAADVANSPSFKEVWPRIAKYIDGAIVAVHFSHFTKKCLSACLKNADMPNVSCSFLDTHALGKALFPELMSYDLDSVSDAVEGRIVRSTNTMSKVLAISDIVNYAAEHSPRKISNHIEKTNLS